MPAVATLTATKGYAQVSAAGGDGGPCTVSTGCGPGLICCNGICSSTCGGGGYAGTLVALSTAPLGGGTTPFISPDLVGANAAPGKSGYLVNNAGQGAQILAQANTCNNIANSQTDFLSTATPITVGTTGQRSFGSDARGTIFQNNTGVVLAAPLAVALPAISMLSN